MSTLPGPGDGHAEEGAARVLEAVSSPPAVAVILGSGLGDAVAGLEAERTFSFTDLPGFPEPSVPGHPGRLAVGSLAGVPTAAFLGRVHFYEGHPMSLVTLPARLAAALGARVLVVTAAAGGLDPDLDPGTIVVGVDHLSFLGENPLRGWRDPEGAPVFADLSRAYDPALAEVALSAAARLGVPATRGVYAAMPGPTYETPAELRFIREAGATVVGMSVVPEVCAAAALGLRCVGLFCVTNRTGEEVSHREVTEVARASAGRLGALLEGIVPALVEEGDGR